MKLTSFRVTEFKSVRDSNEIRSGDVTCLVGKNEAGKTALLQALYRLNPVVDEHGTYDVTDDFPRIDVEDYQQDLEAGRREPTAVVKATFQLEDEDLVDLEDELGEILPNRELTLSKGYQGNLVIGLRVDEGALLKNLIEEADLPAKVKKEATKRKTLAELSEFLSALTTEYQSAVKKANQIEDPNAKKKALEAARAQADPPGAVPLRATLAKIQERGPVIYVWQEYLKEHFPQFLYFDEYYQMSGQANVQAMKKRQAEGKLLDSDRPMLGLIDLARLDLDNLLDPKRTEKLLAKLNGASNHLSKQILKYWSQNQHLRIGFDLRPGLPEDPPELQGGMNLLGRVHDSKHFVDTPLGSRSKGFLWFFSFLAWFSQQKKKSEKLILLLDEPGLFLHAKAQGDLLRYIEAELKPHHQVIYSTHSPFMVDPTQFDRVRIVEDKTMETDGGLPPERQGSKVSEDVLEVGRDSLFPLQGALGYELAQTLFVGPNCLIVEGASDLLAIQAMSSVLEEEGREGLSQDWVLTPVGGSDKVPTFVALIGAQQGMRVATLIDLQRKDKQRIENIFRGKLLRKERVRTYADFNGKGEADLEDMFEPDFYLKLVNEEYGKALSKPVVLSDLPQGGERLLPRLEKHFESSPLAGTTKFNHYRPARYFAENQTALKPELSAATLDRFEEAFKALNALL